MPTAASSTDGSRIGHLLREEWWAVQDVGHLLHLRASTVRRRRNAIGLAVFVVITVAASVVPAYLPHAGGKGYAFNLLLLMPSALAGFQLLALASAVASGGGRELVPRDQLVAYPVNPTTDHLGALLLAPLNIAWLLQCWLLLGSASFALGPHFFLPAVIGAFLWVLAATAVAQIIAWSMEGLRRLRHGITAVRLLGAVGLVTAASLQITHRLSDVLDALPTQWLVTGLIGGFSWRWLLTVALIVGIFVVAVVLGAVPAHLTARLQPREELRVESGRYRARPMPSSDVAMLVRVDRASVWRAVPMRRGLVVLSVGPGLVSLAGNLPWNQLTILPGLVASGGALLFGVNAWSLEGRGALWRESLPVQPSAVFTARAWVILEFLVVASAITLGLAVLRAGTPSAAELSAVLCTWAVVLLQVVSAALRWSLRSPYAVDLRSARATPAPPLAMVGYSTKLAASTTVTSLVFSGLSRVEAWPLSVLVAAPFVAWSLLRLLRARDGWVDAPTRARVVMTVAG
ncbi:hypothetical protein SAMN04487968_10422 [Nocardioides terrae]|uniref:ABC-2 type transport system permease protein n=1 Tax=Nocardioides terrae TaxID=574651 RepID=A0A1I1GQA6_9ACTN|nr:hypothetical protein [Nocardioides terrae]SFC13472.1 hypothetical protein SAMN04487968_10422 [Nocardioides terrae]